MLSTRGQEHQPGSRESVTTPKWSPITGACSCSVLLTSFVKVRLSSKLSTSEIRLILAPKNSQMLYRRLEAPSRVPLPSFQLIHNMYFFGLSTIIAPTRVELWPSEHLKTFLLGSDKETNESLCVSVCLSVQHKFVWSTQSSSFWLISSSILHDKFKMMSAVLMMMPGWLQVDFRMTSRWNYKIT